MTVFASNVIMYSQPAIGIVKRILGGNLVELFIPTLRFPFNSAKTRYTASIGEILVLWITEDGFISVKNKFHRHETWKCFLEMYLLTPKRAKVIPKSSIINFYTQEFTNHNSLETFTIDPENSVDFDDAISVDLLNNTVYIHIVDIVGSKISSKSLDNLKSKCFSLYLSTDHTEHLLDINDVNNSSLVKDNQRNVITIKAILDDNGCVVKYGIYKSTIIVKNRYNYSNVDLTLPSIKFLAKLSESRSKNVKYNINLPSIRVNINDVTTENTNDITHSLVATTMILGNIIVSKHLSEFGVKLPNRFHEKLVGIDIPVDFKPTKNEAVNSYILVKQFRKAYYSVDNSGHFGLNIDNYVHFTSPLRRYSDTIIHFILAGHSYTELELSNEIDYINYRQSIVKSIQNLYIKWKTVKYLGTQIKEKHTIYVTGINKTGVLWFMPDLCLNGFIHISTIKPKQYFRYSNNCITGMDTSDTIRIYSKLDVVVTYIDPITKVVSLLIEL